MARIQRSKLKLKRQDFQSSLESNTISL